MNVTRIVALIAAGFACAAISPGRAAAPVIVQSSAGRFEFATVDPNAGHAVAALAEEMWRHLAKPLGLPEAFSSPVFVRLLPPPGDGRTAAFEVNVEPGGVVSLWWRGDPSEEALLRRALVRGLLTRLGVSQRGASVNPAAWLEHACVAWWRTRADGARLDDARYRAARMGPPSFASLLDWPNDAEPDADAAAALVWLMGFLQGESGAGGEWAALLRRLLAGMDPQAAVASSYPGRFQGVESRELWWQTGWHHLRRVRVLPVQEAAESKAALLALARFIYAGAADDADRLVPLSEVVSRAAEPAVAADLARRLDVLNGLTPALHPFYLNAGLSLADALRAAVAGTANAAESLDVFEGDLRAGNVLEEASRAALDALDKVPAVVRPPGKG